MYPLFHTDLYKLITLLTCLEATLIQPIIAENGDGDVNSDNL